MKTLVLTEKCPETPIVWKLSYNENGKLDFAYWQFGKQHETLIGKVTKETKRGFTIESYILTVGVVKITLQRQHFDIIEVNE